MIGYIRGIVTLIKDNYIVLENNNIGYKIYVPVSNSYTLDSEYKIYIYNYFRPEEYSLYGFKEEKDLDIFEKIISVKGIGPKMGMKFLAYLPTDKLIDSIKNEDITYLKTIPKVGDKMARQLILELKNSLSEENVSSNNLVRESLKVLGFKASDIDYALGSVDNNLSLEENIKICLKILKK